MAIVLILTACRSPSGPAGKKVFYYNESDGIATLDPAFAKNRSIMWVVHQLYNTLVETDKDLHFVPALARRWEVSADRCTWTFHLRTDVFFHDDPAFMGGRGRRLTAADVVYSFNRLLDRRTASSGAWIFHDRIDTTGASAPAGSGGVGSPAGAGLPGGGAFQAVDDSTFRLRLSRPFNPILGLLSMEYCSIVPHEAVEAYGKDFRSHPCGTGPFRLRSWEEGDRKSVV